MLTWWEPPAAPAPRIPAPQSTHLVRRGFSAQHPVSGLAGGAQHPAEGMESHLGALLTDFVDLITPNAPNAAVDRPPKLLARCSPNRPLKPEEPQVGNLRLEMDRVLEPLTSQPWLAPATWSCCPLES
jgi:hypothetical protein